MSEPREWKTLTGKVPPHAVEVLVAEVPSDHVLEMLELADDQRLKIENVLYGVKIIASPRFVVFGRIVMVPGVHLTARIRNLTDHEVHAVLRIYARPISEEENYLITGDWPRCEQDGCGGMSFASYVWPGQGRMHSCAQHFMAAAQVFEAMGLAAKSMDVKLTAREMRDLERVAAEKAELQSGLDEAVAMGHMTVTVRDGERYYALTDAGTRYVEEELLTPERLKRPGTGR